MKEVTAIILNVVFTAFAVYGIYVLATWKKAAQKVSKMCDETLEETHPTEKGGATDTNVGGKEKGGAE